MPKQKTVPLGNLVQRRQQDEPYHSQAQNSNLRDDEIEITQHDNEDEEILKGINKIADGASAAGTATYEALTGPTAIKVKDASL